MLKKFLKSECWWVIKVVIAIFYGVGMLAFAVTLIALKWLGYTPWSGCTTLLATLAIVGMGVVIFQLGKNV